MALSDELISLFVKTTKDDKKTPTEATVYGTIVVDSGIKYVQLDGSEELTPISTTTNAIAGEKVVVRIKNHSATVIGNITSPSATSKDVDEVVGNFENDLEVERAKINKLDGTIAEFDDLYAKEADFTELKADVAEIQTLTADHIEASNAEIENLKTTKLDAAAAEIEYASIDSLNATNAIIDTLTSDVGEIDTLVSEFISGGSVQAQFANAVIAQLGEAWIKSAMIDEIITDNVTVKSEDGKLLIADETIQIKDDTRVRVQIGKDDDGDYSFYIWDAEGKLMFGQGGITEAAIKSEIIRNDMIAPDANISASKLYLDEEKQTLDVAFKTMTTTVDGLTETVTSQGTNLSVVQGQIETKIWKTDISEEINNINVGRNYFAKCNINNLAWGSSVISEGTNYRGYTIAVNPGENWTLYRTDTTNNRWRVYFMDVEPADGVEADYAALNNDNQLANTVNYLAVPDGMTWMFIYLSDQADDIPNIMLEKGNKASASWIPAPEDLDSDISTLSTQYSEIDQTIDTISLTVADHTTQIESKADSSEVTEVSDKIAELELGLDGFQVTVSETYVTKDEADDENLIRNSNFAIYDETFAHWVNEGMSAFVPSVDSDNTYAHLETTSAGGVGCRIYHDPASFTHIISKTYTLSFTAKSSVEDTVLVSSVAGEYNQKEYTLTTELTRYRFTYTSVSSGSLTFWLRDADTDADITSIKLEEGSVATNWSLSPDDIASAADINTVNTTLEDTQDQVSNVTDRVATAESKLEVLSGSVLTLVTDEESGTVSIQNPDGWTFSTSELLEALALTESKVEGFDGSIKDVESQLETLETDLSALAGYIQLHPDGDEPYIELGKFGNSFKLRITNTAIQFKEDDAIPAHIDNKSLHIQKAVIDNELQIGGYVWKKRANNNVGLMWKGEV